MARNAGCGRHGGRCEVYLAVHVAHAAHEVAVGGGDAALTGSQNAHVAAETGTAGGGRDDAAGIQENVGVALMHTGPVDALGGGNDDAPDVGAQMISLHHGGGSGETCALALLLGFAYLLIRRVVTWQTPVCFVGTVFLMSLILGQDALAQVLSGGLLLGAIFMAADYSTSPCTAWGKVLFGIGAGLLTVLIRFYGAYAEGVSFAILFMNILTPYLTRWTRTKPLGGAKA